MDGTFLEIAIFLFATFAGAVVAGVAGFAFGLVAAAIWLYVLTPAESAALIVGFGLVVQGYAVWKLRAALAWSRLWPFVAGAAFGVPLGVAILAAVSPAHVRAGIGVLLVLYATYALARPSLPPVAAGPASDAGVGFLNGVLAGVTGLAGLLVTIWCGLRGWPKDVQRATFQPVGVAIFLMTGVWLGAGGHVPPETLRLFAIGLPALLAGAWVGLKLYGRLDEAGFRKVVLVLLLAAGVALTVSAR